jgi:hypothetical protein
VLSDGSTVVESPTTVSNEEEYYVQIQGSDRKYPAIVLRRKHRGTGATILTVSKFGQHSALYLDYEYAIAAYVVERERRLYNTDNTPDNRENPTTRNAGESGSNSARESWIDKTIQGVVERKRRLDNSAENSD